MWPFLNGSYRPERRESRNPLRYQQMYKITRQCDTDHTDMFVHSCRLGLISPGGRGHDKKFSCGKWAALRGTVAMAPASPWIICTCSDESRSNSRLCKSGSSGPPTERENSGSLVEGIRTSAGDSAQINAKSGSHRHAQDQQANHRGGVFAMPRTYPC